MGTINYGTSEYITMGFRPYCFCDFANDSEVIEAYREATGDAYALPSDTYIFDIMRDCEDCDAENAAYYVGDFGGRFVSVTLEPGYYDGSYLEIKTDFDDFDDEDDRAEALQEADRLRAALENCAGVGMVQCFPGWCTAYSDYNETLAGIAEAVEEMRRDILDAETWEQYEARQAQEA